MVVWCNHLKNVLWNYGEKIQQYFPNSSISGDGGSWPYFTDFYYTSSHWWYLREGYVRDENVLANISKKYASRTLVILQYIIQEPCLSIKSSYFFSDRELLKKYSSSHGTHGTRHSVFIIYFSQEHYYILYFIILDIRCWCYKSNEHVFITSKKKDSYHHGIVNGK